MAKADKHAQLFDERLRRQRSANARSGNPGVLATESTVSEQHLRGKFIVFDGGEGCGKSTQAHMLADRLSSEGHGVLHVHDPGTTRIGQMIRRILLDPGNKDMALRCRILL